MLSHQMVSVFIFSFAEQVSVGDEVLIYKTDNLTTTKVIGITSFMMQGTNLSQSFLYSPVLSNCFISSVENLFLQSIPCARAYQDFKSKRPNNNVFSYSRCLCSINYRW